MPPMKSTAFKFSAVQTLSVGSIDPKNPPARIKILNWGENPTASKGTFIVGEKTLSTLSATMRAHGFDQIALDYEHNTFPGTSAFKEAKEPREVAGHGPVEVVRGEGVFLNVSWTPDGPAKAANFIDVSAVPATDESNEVIFIHSAALCRQGEVFDLHLSTLSIDMKHAEPDADNAVLDMLRKALARLMGLDPNAALDDVIAAVSSKDLVPLPTLSVQIGTAATASATNFQSLEARLTCLSNDWTAKVDVMLGKLEALSVEVAAKFDDRERQLIRDEAARAGKLIALSVEAQAKLTPAELRDHVAKMPATVPVTRLTPLSVVEPAKDGAADATRSAEQKRIALEISDANPGKGWPQCWQEAGAKLQAKS
jgi:hypothetical protein